MGSSEAGTDGQGGGSPLLPPSLTHNTPTLTTHPHNPPSAYCLVISAASVPLAANMSRSSSSSLLVLLSLLLATIPSLALSSYTPSTYDVDWTTPSTRETESMPLGNGDLTLSVWVNATTAALHYYVQPSSSYDENGMLLKLIRGRVSLPFPAPLTLTAFHHHLHLTNSSQTVSFTANGVSVFALVWVDRFHPVVHVSLHTSSPLTLTNTVDIWRTAPLTLGDNWGGGYFCEPRYVYPDTLYRGPGLGSGPGEVLWYHRNDGDAGHTLYDATLQQQRLQNVGLEAFDPLTNRTWGGLLVMADPSAYSPSTVTKTPSGLSASVTSLAPVSSAEFAVYALTVERVTGDEWRARMALVVQAVGSVPAEQRRAAHVQWWGEFYNRSYIEVGVAGNATVGFRVNQALVLQRTQDAMSGYGGYPIHFNGQGWNIGVPGEEEGPDHRQWGSAFWWQNTREAYYPAAPSGDLDLLYSMFAFYQSVSHAAEVRTRAYYGHTGILFEETITLLGLPTNGGFGWVCDSTVERHMNDFIRYHWDGALELCTLMLQYYHYTADSNFVRATLLPMCNAITGFFYEHFPRNAANQTVFYPSQSLETWQCQDPSNHTICPLNSIIYIAGIQSVLTDMLTLPIDLAPDSDRARWALQLAALPPIPAGPCPTDASLQCLWPAEHGWVYGNTGNTENVELYTVWPYGLYGLAQPGYDVVVNNYRVRPFPCNEGWCQDVADAAYLGLRNETAAMAVERALAPPADGWRFPTFVGPYQDSTPNEDHLSVLRTAMIAMVMQEVPAAKFDLGELRRNREEGGVYVVDEEAMREREEGEEVGVGAPVILLFGALPQGWDVGFKMWASGGTVVEAQCTGGAVTALTVTPAARKKDVVLVGCTKMEGSVFEAQVEAVAQEGQGVAAE